MVKLNTIEELESTVYSSRNETSFKINVTLHPSDIDLLHDVIINFVKNNATKSKKFIEEFNSTMATTVAQNE